MVSPAVHAPRTDLAQASLSATLGSISPVASTSSYGTNAVTVLTASKFSGPSCVSAISSSTAPTCAAVFMTTGASTAPVDAGDCSTAGSSAAGSAAAGSAAAGSAPAGSAAAGSSSSLVKSSGSMEMGPHVVTSLACTRLEERLFETAAATQFAHDIADSFIAEIPRVPQAFCSS